MKKTNILLITTDTQRTDSLGCMGGIAHSPNLDALSASGVLFTQSHTASPVCMPARCSLVSGLHTPMHGSIENGVSRIEDMPFFTDQLREAGYVTIMAGKTHFGKIPYFDYNYATQKGIMAEADDIFDTYMKERGLKRSAPPTCDEEHIDWFSVNNTIQAIDKIVTESDQPFFAFCSLYSPHGPVKPFGEWASMYDPDLLPAINYVPGEQDKLPRQTAMLVGLRTPKTADIAEDNPVKSTDMFSDDEINGSRAAYYGLCTYCDYLVGKLIDYLEQKGLRENTLIIFTSDHGQQYFDHGFNDKHNYFDESIRVPFIMSMPGTLPQGKICTFSGTTDIMPTILAAAGIDTMDAQGYDLFTPLKNGLPSPRKCAVSTLYQSAMVATEKYKLTCYFDDATVCLFDRINDPKEQHDLSNDPAYQKVKEDLLNGLMFWRTNMCDYGKMRRNGTHLGGPVAKRAVRGLCTGDAKINDDRLAEMIKDYL